MVLIHVHFLFNFFHCLHLLLPISPQLVSLPLCTSVIPSQFSSLSSYNNLALGPDFSVSYTTESYITSSYKAHICTWLWACFTFVTCWSECSECPLLLIWPYHSCAIFLDGYQHFSNTLRFPVTTHLLFYSETMITCASRLFSAPERVSLGLCFFLQLQLLSKIHYSSPSLINQDSWWHSQSFFVFCGPLAGICIIFALEFTYCSS